jgi:hypothetical protein
MEASCCVTTIETQVVIDAPAHKVWAILTDFPGMAAWNPFIRSISGSPTVGERLSVQIAPPDQAAMTFRPTVLAALPERELRWRGALISRWIFAGEHYFVLDAAGPRTTRLTHGEHFSGLLAPLLMRGRTLTATTKGFAAMNAALKRRAE